MSLRTLLSLILCNAIWSAHPLMGKYLLESFTPAQGAWLRYTSALLVYGIAVAVARVARRGRRQDGRPEGLLPTLAQEPFLRPRGSREALLVVALGFSAFCFSPLLQMAGLASSRATDNSLIVALEPLFTVLAAWALLGERPRRLHVIAFAVALAGFALLTGLSAADFRGGVDPRLAGNLLMLASLTGEALYSTLGRKLAVRHPPAAIFGAAIAVGVVSLTLCLAVAGKGFPSLSQLSRMSGHSALGLLWLGPMGTALSYLYWMSALRRVPVASLALTLFVQPVLGPVWGMVFLGERLSVMQGVGSGLILLAVVGQATVEIRQARRANFQ